MPATAAGHPSAAALAGFALGKLDAPVAEAVHTHLAGCAECRTVVETTPRDTLLGLLQTRPGDTPAAGTLSVPNPDLDLTGLPPELRDHPRYRIVRKLGQGGMGAVYEAEHKIMQRMVAIKVIAPGLVDSPDAAERFQREVRAAAKLDHPNIVRAFDADAAGGAMLLAMEFVPGRSLADVVRSKGPLPVGYACQCVRQAALGLQHAADHQMVHRDIKPQNLMLTDKGVVKILDFGLAKLASERTTQAGLTGRGMVMGTPEYMAPEQALDTAGADVRADIYALGCTLFYLLTGRPPFRGDSALEVVTKQVTDAPPRVTDLRPDVPDELADLVGRLLAKAPAARPQTPRDVADELRPFTKKEQAPAAVPAGAPFADLPHVTMTVRRPLTVRRRLVPAALAAAAALAAVVAAVIWVKTPAGSVRLEVTPDDAEVSPAAGPRTPEPAVAQPELVMIWVRGIYEDGRWRAQQDQWLYSNGKTGKPDGADTWSLKGNVLTVIKAQGQFIDRAFISDDGRRYAGSSRLGTPLRGVLKWPPPGSAAAGLPTATTGGPASEPAEPPASAKPELIMVWKHEVFEGTKWMPRPDLLQFSNGKVGKPESDYSWTRNGHTLVLDWGPRKTVDRLIVSDDGQDYAGTNQADLPIRGTLRWTKPREAAEAAPPNKVAVGEPPASLRTPALSKPELLMIWGHEVREGATWTRRSDFLQFLNGKVGSSDNTWTLTGKVLTINGPNGEVKYRLTIADDGQSFAGKSQAGQAIRGKLRWKRE